MRLYETLQEYKNVVEKCWIDKMSPAKKTTVAGCPLYPRTRQRSRKSMDSSHVFPSSIARNNGSIQRPYRAYPSVRRTDCITSRTAISRMSRPVPRFPSVRPCASVPLFSSAPRSPPVSASRVGPVSPIVPPLSSAFFSLPDLSFPPPP